MKFNIYGRFQLDILREHDAWVVYRAASGKRVALNDIVIPPEVPGKELAIYLDDLFHELAGFGQEVEQLPDSA